MFICFVQNCAIDDLLSRRPQGQGQINGGSLVKKLHDGVIPDRHERQYLVQTVGRYLMNNCAVYVYLKPLLLQLTKHSLMPVLIVEFFILLFLKLHKRL